MNLLPLYLTSGCEHLVSGNIVWGSLTIVIMFLPFILGLTQGIIKKLKKKEVKSYGFQHLPMVQAMRWKPFWPAKVLLKSLNFSSNLRIFFGLATMNTSNPLNSYLVSTLKAKASEISLSEAFLESAPQMVLQLYIFLRTGTMSMKNLLYNWWWQHNHLLLIFRWSKNLWSCDQLFVPWVCLIRNVLYRKGIRGKRWSGLPISVECWIPVLPW